MTNIVSKIISPVWRESATPNYLMNCGHWIYKRSDYNQSPLHCQVLWGAVETHLELYDIVTNRLAFKLKFY